MVILYRNDCEGNLAKDRDRVDRIEQNVSKLLIWLGESKDKLIGLGYGSQVEDIQRSLGDKLTTLRTNLSILEGFKDDPFQTEPTIQSERYRHIQQIQNVRTSLEFDIIPSLKKLHKDLKLKIDDKDFAYGLGQIIDDIKRGVSKDTAEEPISSKLDVIIILDNDLGERQNAITHQMMDIAQALQFDIKNEVEIKNECAKVFVQHKTTNHLVLMYYVPNIEQQKLVTEVLAFYGVYSKQKKSSSTLTGQFFTAALIEQALPSLEEYLGEDFKINGGPDIVNLLTNANNISSPEKVKDRLSQGPLKFGTLSLIYYQLEYYWMALSEDRTYFSLLNGKGEAISEEDAEHILISIVNLIGGNARERYIDLTKVKHPEKAQILNFKPSVAKQHDKSNSWFDYLLPSHPDFFVGRNKEIQDAFQKIDDIQYNKYPGRGIVIKGASGSGKSSFIFKLGSQTDKANSECFIYSVDSRGCFGPDFLAVVFEDFIRNLLGWKKLETSDKQYLLDLLEEAKPLASFKSIISTAKHLSRTIKEKGLITLLCFDQFEYLTPYPNVVSDIANLLENMNLQKSNIVIGFILRTDMNLPHFSDFPFDFWSRIQKQSWHLQLGPLDNVAEQQLVLKMEESIGRNFSKEFCDEILQFSQGRPWVLKRVGSHLVNKYRKATQEAPIKLELRLEELFGEDILFLSDDERKNLKAIAKAGPASISEIELEDMLSQNILRVVDALVDRRLISKIGEKYDVYHDRFKEYILKQMLDPNEKLRFEIETTLRAGRFMMGGIQGYLMLIMTAPYLILESSTNQRLCLDVSREIADRFYALRQQDGALQRVEWLPTKSQNKDSFLSNCCLTAYRMYSILTTQFQTDERIYRRKEEILNQILEDLAKLSPTTLVEQAISSLDEADLEKYQDRLVKLLNRPVVIRGMIKRLVNSGSINKLKTLLNDEQWQKEDRLRINIEVTRYVINLGRIEEADLIYEEITSTLKEISEQGILSRIAQSSFENAADEIGFEIGKYWSLKGDLNMAKQYLKIPSSLEQKGFVNIKDSRQKSLFDSSHELKYWIAIGLIKSKMDVNELTLPQLQKLLGFELASYHSYIIKLLLMPDEVKSIPYQTPLVIHDIAVGCFIIGDVTRAENIITSSMLEHDKIGKIYLEAALTMLQIGEFHGAKLLTEKILRDPNWLVTEGKSLIGRLLSLGWPFELVACIPITIGV